SWKSKKARLPLLPDLEEFDWSGRSVELVFDSDVGERPDLLAALGQLAVELGDRGARVARVDLPKLNGAKTGLDDYLLVKDTNAFAALPRQLFDAELYALNAEYVYLRSPSGYIVRLGDGEIQSVEHFKTETANRKLTRMDTAGRPSRLHAGVEWIRWPIRREV